MTLWHPDTCGCAIQDYHTPNAVFVKRCARHSSAAVADVLTENRKKNTTVAPLLDNNIPFDAYFDDKGNLVVSTPDPAAAAPLIKDPSITIALASVPTLEQPV